MNKLSTIGTQVNEIDVFDQDNSLPDVSNVTGPALPLAMWGVNAAVIQEMANVNKIYASKHGMFSGVPIVCKGSNCAYKDVCMISPAQRSVGKRCPMEIAAILSRYEQWCAHFGIDTQSDMLDPKDLVDATLIKDLINIEIQMLRAENKVALNGDFMSDTLLDIDKKCQPYFGKVVSPEVEFIMTLQDKKIKILNQLNSTRKDKAADKRNQNASEEAIKIFQQLKEIQSAKRIANISDLEFDDNGVVKVEETEVNPVGQLVGGDDSGRDGSESYRSDVHGEQGS